MGQILVRQQTVHQSTDPCWQTICPQPPPIPQNFFQRWSYKPCFWFYNLQTENNPYRQTIYPNPHPPLKIFFLKKGDPKNPFFELKHISIGHPINPVSLINLHLQKHISVCHLVLLDHVGPEIEGGGIGEEHDRCGCGKGNTGQVGFAEGGFVGRFQLLAVHVKHLLLLTQARHCTDVLYRLCGGLSWLFQSLFVLTLKSEKFIF